MKGAPKPFDILERISELRERYGDVLDYEWRIGGYLWTLAEGIIFGMPKEVGENPIYRFILGVLLARLAWIFEAIKMLAVAAKLAKQKGKSIVEAPIPETAVREFILNIIPHILGEISGIDGDGLPTEELIETYQILLNALPERIGAVPAKGRDSFRGRRTLGPGYRRRRLYWQFRCAGLERGGL